MLKLSIFSLLGITFAHAEGDSSTDNSLSVKAVTGKNLPAGKSTKKQGFGGKDAFDLLLGAKDRELMQAQTHDTKYISNIYRSGNFLIYDCENGNYACVNKDGFEYCKSVRKDSEEKGSKVLSCAPLKKFTRYKFCVEKQKELVDYPVDQLFCISRDVLEEE